MDKEFIQCATDLADLLEEVTIKVSVGGHTLKYKEELSVKEPNMEYSDETRETKER